MSAVDFYAHVVARGDVLGVGIGADPAAWEAGLGADYLDVPSPGFIRRDYGLVEVSFREDPNAWSCCGFSVQVHRLPKDGPSAVPDALRNAYGPFPHRTGFADLRAALAAQAFPVEPDDDTDTPTAGIRRFRVARSGARIFVDAGPGTPDGSGDVWRLSVSPGWWQHAG